MAKFNDYLKTAILLFIIVQIGPPAIDNIKKQWQQSLEPHNKIGLINFHGVLQDTTHYHHYLKKYFQDPSIKAILLNIESTGGASGTSQAIFYTINELKKECPKPIVAYIENTCLSGGYYIAAATDHIVTTGTSTIGSIGAQIIPIFKIKQFLNNWNIECESVSAGSYKNTFNPYTEITPEQQTMLKSVAQNSYQQFAQDIASKRHLQINKITEWGEGKIFTGQQAYNLKLVDSIGSFKTAVEFIKKNIIPSNRKIEWIKPPSKSRWEKLFESFDHFQATGNTHGIMHFIEKIRSFLQQDS